MNSFKSNFFKVVISFLVFGAFNSAWAANGSGCRSAQRADANKLDALTEFLNCQEMSIGQSKTIVKSRELDSGHLMDSNYILTKTSDKKYKIEFSLDFIEDVISFYVSTASTADMANRAKQCLKKVSPYILGPNGEQIEFVAVTNLFETSPKHWGLRHRIFLEEPDYRSNKMAYEKDIDCATIFHEVLHLTGLVDEYEETDIEEESGANQRKFNCRVLGNSDSIMSNHQLAFARVGLDINGDPLVRGSKKVSKRQKQKSLLEPAHFRALIYPGCQAKNRVYYQCSRRAYTTGVGGVCAPAPRECGRQWLN